MGSSICQGSSIDDDDTEETNNQIIEKIIKQQKKQQEKNTIHSLVINHQKKNIKKKIKKIHITDSRSIENVIHIDSRSLQHQLNENEKNEQIENERRILLKLKNPKLKTDSSREIEIEMEGNGNVEPKMNMNMNMNMKKKNIKYGRHNRSISLNEEESPYEKKRKSKKKSLKEKQLDEISGKYKSSMRKANSEDNNDSDNKSGFLLNTSRPRALSECSESHLVKLFCKSILKLSDEFIKKEYKVKINKVKLKKEDEGGEIKMVNNFIVCEKIGEGSFGVVKRCYHVEKPQKFYAIKECNLYRIHKKNKSSTSFGKKNPFEMVRNEIVVLSKINHENIMKLYWVLIDFSSGIIYLISELFGGGILFKINKGGKEKGKTKPLTENEAHQHFKQICKAVKYLHNLNIAHRDIKPENIVLTKERDKCSLIDFGSCDIYKTRGDKCYDTRGTAFFHPPEFCIPTNKIYDGKVQDVWCLGCTLYSLVYSYLPIIGKIDYDYIDNQWGKIFKMYKDILKFNLSFPKDIVISESLKDLLKKTLEKNPEKRIDIEGILNHEWVNKNNCNNENEFRDEDIDEESAVLSCSTTPRKKLKPHIEESFNKENEGNGSNNYNYRIFKTPEKPENVERNINNQWKDNKNGNVSENIFNVNIFKTPEKPKVISESEFLHKKKWKRYNKDKNYVKSPITKNKKFNKDMLLENSGFSGMMFRKKLNYEKEETTNVKTSFKIVS